MMQERLRSGFTLLEMMVALGILAIIVAALTQMLVRQTRTYTVVDQVTEAQQNLRAISDVIEREARATGLMVPESGAICGVDNTNRPDILVLTDSDAVNPGTQTANDLGMRVAAVSYSGVGQDTLQLTPQPGLANGTIDNAAFYDNDGDGVQDSDFMDSPASGATGGVIVSDANNPGRGSSCGIIVSGSVNLLGGTTTVGVDYDFGTTGAQKSSSGALRALQASDNPEQLVAVPAHVYQVNNAFQLLRDGVVIANDVEDLQMAFFIDQNGDGLVGAVPVGTPPPLQDPTEYPGSVPGAPVYQAPLWDHSELREIRVDLVVRTRTPDADVAQNAALAQNTFIARENRVAPGNPPDGFRRRVHSITVRARNIGHRSG